MKFGLQSHTSYGYQICRKILEHVATTDEDVNDIDSTL